MKHLLILAAALACGTALAQSDSASVARSETQVAGNGIVTINNSGQPTNTANRADLHTNQAASAPSVFVNAPSADTCEKAGFGLAVGTVGGNGGLNIPRGMSDPCNVRADTVNLKFTGAPDAVIKARHCMSAEMAEAYARAGMPCVDQRPQQAAIAARPQAEASADPYIAARMGR